MNTIVIKHVPVDPLPLAWRKKLAAAPMTDAHVTARIEQEPLVSAHATEDFVTDDPAFGIWRDRADVADVAAYLDRIRAPRFNPDGSRHEP